MAGRALRWYDVPCAIGLMLAGHRATELLFAPAAPDTPFAVRALAVAVPGALAFAVVAFLSSYYHQAQPVRIALHRAAIGFVIGAVLAAAWSLVAG